MTKLNMDKMDKDYKIAVLEEKLGWFEKRYGPYIEKRGLSNWRNLFRKPTLHEWTILFMLIMGLFIAWSYNHDIESCRDTLDNLQGICLEYCGGINYQHPLLNISELNLTFKEENSQDASPP